MGASALYGSSRCRRPGYQSTAFSADDSHLARTDSFDLSPGAAVRGLMESRSEKFTRKPCADSLALGRRRHGVGGNHRSDPALRCRPELVFGIFVWGDRISDRSYLCPGDL